MYQGLTTIKLFIKLTSNYIQLDGHISHISLSHKSQRLERNAASEMSRLRTLFFAKKNHLFYLYRTTFCSTLSCRANLRKKFILLQHCFSVFFFHASFNTRELIPFMLQWCLPRICLCLHHLFQVEEEECQVTPVHISRNPYCIQ